MECVQHQLDCIVVKHVFPPREPGASFLRLVVEADEDSVQVLVVIAEVGLGAPPEILRGEAICSHAEW
jgi:hypothetical protein